MRIRRIGQTTVFAAMVVLLVLVSAPGAGRADAGHLAAKAHGKAPRCLPARRILGRRFPRRCGARPRPSPLVRTTRSGIVPLDEARRAFSLAIGRLPGVRLRPGESGRFRSGSGPIRWLRAHFGELTAAQRRAASRLLLQADGGHAARGAKAPSAAEKAHWKALFAAANGRIAAHLGEPLGLPYTVELLLTQPPGDKREEGHLDPIGSGASLTCAIAITPTGRSDSLDDQRLLAAHEAFHCFQLAMMGAARLLSAPDWLIEGSAEWAGTAVGEEMAGHHVSDGYWNDYLRFPQLDLFTRAYDAIGWYAHLAENGVDPWREIPNLLATPGDGTYQGAYDLAVAKAGTGFLNTWASGVVRNKKLGPGWDTTGPGITSVAYEPDRFSITNGKAFSHSGDAESSDVDALDLRADIVEVQTSPAVPAFGRLRASDGSEHALTDASYCTRMGGCTCPEGTPGAGGEPPTLARGEAALAFSVHHSATRVTVRGVSLAAFCAKGPSSQVGVSGEIGGRFARPGACGNDGFGGFKAELTTTIAGKLYILQVSVGSPYWAGPGNYTINDPRATLGPSVTFTDGRGSSWDTQDVPSGPAGRFTINADGSGSLNVTMQRPGGGGEYASGTWTCTA